MDAATIRYYSGNAQLVADRYESVVNSLSERFAQSFAPGSKVLDIGCGSGRDLAVLRHLGFDGYGVDPIQEFVDYAQKIHPELRGKIVEGSLPNLVPPFGGEFDGVLCSAVLMHISVDNLADTASAIRSCLKQGGRLLYSVPSQRSDTVDENRDLNGRLFIPDQGDRLLVIFLGMGFSLIARWIDSDSMGREGIVWDSVLMERKTSVEA